MAAAIFLDLLTKCVFYEFERRIIHKFDGKYTPILSQNMDLGLP